MALKPHWEVAIYKQYGYLDIGLDVIALAEKYGYQKARIVMDWHIFCFESATSANLFDMEVCDLALGTLKLDLRTEIKLTQDYVSPRGWDKV